MHIPKGTKLSSFARQTCAVCGSQHYWATKVPLWTMIGSLTDSITGKGLFRTYCPKCQKQLKENP